MSENKLKIMTEQISYVSKDELETEKESLLREVAQIDKQIEEIDKLLAKFVSVEERI